MQLFVTCKTKQVLRYEVYYDLLLIFDGNKIYEIPVEYVVYAFETENKNKTTEFEIILN